MEQRSSLFKKQSSVEKSFMKLDPTILMSNLIFEWRHDNRANDTQFDDIWYNDTQKLIFYREIDWYISFIHFLVGWQVDTVSLGGPPGPPGGARAALLGGGGGAL